MKQHKEEGGKGSAVVTKVKITEVSGVAKLNISPLEIETRKVVW